MPVEGVKREDLPDLQNTKDARGLGINRAGTRNVKIPLKIARKQNDGIPETVYASVDMFSSVGPEHKGANMSRFVETLMDYEESTLTLKALRGIITDMLQRLGSGANDGYLKVEFDYYMPRLAPVSKKRGVQAYRCSFIGQLKDDTYTCGMTVTATGTNACPCSKEISSPKIGGKGGAHNQRNHIEVRFVPTDNFYWIEDVVDLIESQFSCPIYPLLKREDEKWVTEMAYENPKFVEDLVRDVVVELKKRGITQYWVKSSADESIHHHQAEAYLQNDWNLGG